ncbi:hypothetical protein Taro_022269, partial [Colocasia esculenta]|nr:hypothetical protein [Colocasia esculenta]
NSPVSNMINPGKREKGPDSPDIATARPATISAGSRPLARPGKNVAAYAVAFPPLNRAKGQFACRAQSPCRDLESRRVSQVTTLHTTTGLDWSDERPEVTEK